MEMVKIHHPELDVTETVNVGLAGVLKASGWEFTVQPDVLETLDEIVEVIEGVPRSEAMPMPEETKPKSKPKTKKESD